MKTNPFGEQVNRGNKKMKTGIELIAEERAEQINKHQRSPKEDVEYNNDGQLREAAHTLISSEQSLNSCTAPDGWDEKVFRHMCFNKTYKQRLVIAGALIAAEIDRVQNSLRNF